MSLSALRTELLGAAAAAERHAGLLAAVGTALDAGGYGGHAGRARARAATLRESAGTLRRLAGPVPLCTNMHEHPDRPAA